MFIPSVHRCFVKYCCLDSVKYGLNFSFHCVLCETGEQV